VHDYILWQWGSLENCVLSDDDDIILRTYLLEQKHAGLSDLEINGLKEAVLAFYGWAKAVDLIQNIPSLEHYAYRPTLQRDQIRRRDEIFSEKPQEREIARLRALNAMAQQMNRAQNIKEVFQIALETLVAVLKLESAWAFLLPIEGSPFHPPHQKPPHDFALASSTGLPSGLADNDFYFLCQPGDCHCQDFFRSGSMRRAVNIVDCSRLAAADAADGETNHLLFHASLPIQVGELRAGIINVATEDWQLLTSSDLQILSLIGSQVSETLERARLYDLAEAQRRRLANELRLAHVVQASLLPEQVPVIKGISLAADWRAANEMAGDFYDFIDRRDGSLGIVVADVSDKGAPAAMFMGMAQSLIRTLSVLHDNPAETLKDVNSRVMALANAGMFVTVFFGIFYPATRTLLYASAGQDPPLCLRSSGKLEQLTPTGPLIGLFDKLEITNREITLQAGDTVLFYTDGLTDSLNDNEERYELSKLVACLQDAPQSHAADILDHVMQDINTFTGSAAPFDDMTCIVLRVEA
jgi:serine phosphatase RsbU (regulator of sigma subunit)